MYHFSNAGAAHTANYLCEIGNSILPKSEKLKLDQLKQNIFFELRYPTWQVIRHFLVRSFYAQQCSVYCKYWYVLAFTDI